MTGYPDQEALYQAAVQRVSEYDLTFDRESEEYFRAHARRAANLIDAGQLPQGVDPAAQFLTLARVAGGIGARTGLGKVTFSDIREALALLCPIWPFCDER